MAVGPKEREAILNAIRVLRKRRVRPSGQKIAWFLRRENLVNEETTVEALDELVRSSDILKVEYKGAISYRLANSKLKTSKPKLAALDIHAVRRAIFEAIAECGSTGGTRHRIAARLTANGFARVVDRLDVILQREARAGGIAKFTEIVDGKSVSMFATVKQFNQNNDDVLSSDTECNDAPENGNPAPFQHLQLQLKMLEKQKNGSRSESPSDNPSKTDDSCDSLDSVLNASDDKMSEIEASPVESPEPETPEAPAPVESRPQTPQNEMKNPVSKRGRPRKLKRAFDEEFYVTDLRRPSTRMKKVPKVFDPSEKGKGTKKNFPEMSNCVVCLGLVTTERLLCCSECSKKAHPTCLNYTKELGEKCLGQDWLCMDCKLCTICGMDHTITTMIFCDKCDRAFHSHCHQPPVNQYPTGDWICFFCLPSNPNNYYNCLAHPPSSIKVENTSRSSNPKGAPVPPYETVVQWTVDQLVQWLNDQGLSEYTHVIREQEIDGMSALLLEKSQVVQNLGLKFGPAVKVFMKIKALQWGTWDVGTF